MLAAFAIEMWFRACGQNPCSTLWVTPLVMARPALPDDGIPAAQRQSLPETLMPLLSSASMGGRLLGRCGLWHTRPTMCHPSCTRSLHSLPGCTKGPASAPGWGLPAGRASTCVQALYSHWEVNGYNPYVEFQSGTLIPAQAAKFCSQDAQATQTILAFPTLLNKWPAGGDAVFWSPWC